jgi:hypothetical protein
VSKMSKPSEIKQVVEAGKQGGKQSKIKQVK